MEGSNDTELMETTKRHTSEEHEGEYTEVDLRLLVSTAAYDTAA